MEEQNQKEQDKIEQNQKEQSIFMFNFLQKEDDFEVTRFRNYETKANITLVALALIFNISLILKTPETIIGIPLKIYNDLTMLFTICIFISFYNFINVMNTFNLQRCSLDRFNISTLEKNEPMIDYVAHINKDLITIINARLLEINKKIKSYKNGLLFLKISTVILAIKIIFVLLGR